MRNTFRVGGRVVSWLDSAPSTSGIAQDVLVFIHAFPVNADTWEAQTAAAPAGWRFLAPDLRGFGHSGAVPEPSGPDERLSLDEYARDVLTLLDHLDVERAFVAGLSMGGYAAFALLRLAPGRVRGLVLANTKAEADGAEARKGRAEMIALLDREGLSAVADQMLPRLLGDTTRRSRPEVVRRVRAMIEANTARGVREAIVRMMNRPDSTSMLAGIACPTLVIASDEDQVTPADAARAMARAIPGAEFVLVEGAGHLSNLEQPESFNQIVTRFTTTHLGG